MKNQSELTEQFVHIVDSHHGIYSGQIFAQRLYDLYEKGNVKGISPEDWQSLLSGPEDEFYTEAWGSIESAEITDENGKKFIVFENEGIFLCPKEIQEPIDWEQLIN